MKKNPHQKRNCRNGITFLNKIIQLRGKATFATVVLLTLYLGKSLAGPCLVNSLIINTGITAAGASVTPFTNYGCTVPGTSVDPFWQVSFLSPGMVTNAIPNSNLYSAGLMSCTSPGMVAATPNADVVGTNVLTGPGGIISCVNANWFYTDNTGPTPLGTQYYATFERDFSTCGAANINVNLNIYVDNYVSSMDIDGVDLGFVAPISGSQNSYTFSTNINLGCGLHKLHINVWNYNTGSTLLANGYFLDVVGTLTSTGLNLVDNTCSSYTCPVPGIVFSTPIAGIDTICAGSTLLLSDTTSGGKWTSGNTAIATVDSVTGLVTGISAGTDTISYTYCSSVMTYPIVVVNSSSTLYTVSGGGNVCPSSLGVNITLSGSDPGVTYQLWYGGTVVATTAGTGSSINFGVFSALGTYTVTATGSYGCITTMAGSATIAICTATVPTVNFYDCASHTCPPTDAYDVVVTGSASSYLIGATVGLNDVPCRPNCTGSISYTATTGIDNFVPYWHYFADMYMPVLACPIPTGCVPPNPDAWGIWSMTLNTVTDPTCGCTWNISGHGTYRHSAGNTDGVNVSVSPLTELSIQPNPNKGVFTIKGALPNTSSSQEAEIEVVDMLGQTVYKDVATIESGGINKDITLGDNIADGVYLVKIINGGESQVIDSH